MYIPKQKYGFGGGQRLTSGGWKLLASGKKHRMPDGSYRSLYVNPGRYPGERRIRVMRAGKDGKRKATYVKPKA